MQNMYSTPLRYTNFNGVEKHTTLHFHLTPREFTDWAIDNMEEANRMTEAFADLPEQIEQNPGLATTEQKITMLQMIRLLAELSYGKPSEDGEYFDKSDKKFAHSAAYDAFRLFLFQNGKELTTFIETILNKDVLKAFTEQIQASAQEGEGATNAQPQKGQLLQSVPAGKDPKDMSREELLEAMKLRNQPEGPQQ